jgi:hypothetical protein
MLRNIHSLLLQGRDMHGKPVPLTLMRMCNAMHCPFPSAPPATNAMLQKRDDLISHLSHSGGDSALFSGLCVCVCVCVCSVLALHSSDDSISGPH